MADGAKTVKARGQWEASRRTGGTVQGDDGLTALGRRCRGNAVLVAGTRWAPALVHTSGFAPEPPTGAGGRGQGVGGGGGGRR